MAAEDWLPDEWLYDDIDFENGCEGISFYPRSPYRHTCKYCGTKNLMWKQIENKWRLFTKKGQHACQR